MTFADRWSNIAIFAEISPKVWKRLTTIYEDFEFRAVQRCANLVDLEKRCKMSIWTQKSALIQLRKSLLKFDDFAENFERSSVSNFSTKPPARGPGRRSPRRGGPRKPRPPLRPSRLRKYAGSTCWAHFHHQSPNSTCFSFCTNSEISLSCGFW